MRLKGVHNLVVLGAALALVGAIVAVLPQGASSTADYMLRLPAYARFRCALCHQSSTPVAGNAPLNPFGDDFKGNGYRWDDLLALKNSDGDRCANGFEIGDSNGDGKLDGGSKVEHSNPGVPDCSISITYKTWGIIKQIFASE